MVKTVGHGNEIGIRIMKSGQKAKDGHPWLFVRFVVLASKGNPRQSRGNKKGYGVEESRKEKVSKLE